MTYTLLTLPFLTLSAVLAVLARRRLRASGARGLLALGITGAVLIGLTVVFDNLMIAAGLFTYANHLGIHLWRMPIEDLSYTIAAVLGLPSLWLLLGGTDPAHTSGAAGDGKDQP